MKVKMKQLQNRLKLRYNEKFYVLKKKHEKKLDAFIKKGHEKMTVMFIPHNEKKIFNFQISKFTISFFVGLFVIILVTSTFAFIRNSATKREEERLMTNYRDTHAILLRYEKLTNSVAELVSDMKPEIEEIYALASGGDTSENIWNTDDAAITGEEELQKMRSVLPSEIYMLRDVERDIIASTNTIRTVKNFVDVRNKVVNETPSIIPLGGNITSLFGWRRSPFGFGRDFHTGIDIAAPEGSEIHATAPGTVSTSGWGGGYGMMVIIKHKYGFETIYGHCSRLAVVQGQVISKGQVIGYVGQTGSATGNHCHYEIRLGNVSINPYPYMSRMW